MCGDGTLLVGVEKCDDANKVDTDFCKSDCQINECASCHFESSLCWRSPPAHNIL
jgi:cysteine-rich repeat protein